jgi:hypothetical protein
LGTLLEGLERKIAGDNLRFLAELVDGATNGAWIREARTFKVQPCAITNTDLKCPLRYVIIALHLPEIARFDVEIVGCWVVVFRRNDGGKNGYETCDGGKTDDTHD